MLEVFSKHVREYLAEQDEWVECMQTPSQSALRQQMSTSVAPSGGLGVPVTQTIADLLTAIVGSSSTRCSEYGRPTSTNSNPTS